VTQIESGNDAIISVLDAIKVKYWSFIPRSGSGRRAASSN
jgi:hypothetical protein